MRAVTWSWLSSVVTASPVSCARSPRRFAATTGVIDPASMADSSATSVETSTGLAAPRVVAARLGLDPRRGHLGAPVEPDEGDGFCSGHADLAETDVELDGRQLLVQRRAQLHQTGHDDDPRVDDCQPAAPATSATTRPTRPAST